MTAETLHDALTLLPGDLVAAANKRRNRSKPPLRLRQWAAMAACLALILCAGSVMTRLFAPKGATEMVTQAPAAAAPWEQYAADEAAPMEQESLQESPAEVSESNQGEAGMGAAMDPAGMLPVLILTDGEQELALEAVGFHWSVTASDGTILGLDREVPAELDRNQELPLLEAESAELELKFPQSPDEIHLRCWSEGERLSGLQILSDPSLVLQSGSCFYEITARFPQGSVTYAFRAIGP